MTRHPPSLLIGGVFALGIVLGGSLGYLLRTSPVSATSSSSAGSGTKHPVTASSLSGMPELGDKNGSGAAIMDFAGQLKAIMALGKDQRLVEMKALAEKMAPDQIRQAIAACASLKPDEKDPLITLLLCALVKLDAQGALTYAEGLKQPAKMQALKQMDTTLAHTDLKAALAFTSSRKGYDAMGDRYDIIAEWAKKDQEGLLAYISQMTKGNAKEEIIDCAASEIGKSDPDQAAALISQMKPGDNQDAALWQMGKGMAVDLKSALDWVTQQSDEHVKNAMMKGLVSAVAENDPAQALAIVQSAALQGVVSEEVYDALFRYASSDDPQGAIKLAESLPDGKTRNAALKTCVKNWVDDDVTAAVHWVHQQTNAALVTQIWPTVVDGIAQDPQSGAQIALSLPAGDSRDQAIQAVSQGLMRINPVDALNLSSNITSDQSRTQTQQRLAQNWLNKDPNAATQWIISSTLPPDIKANLLKQK